jgi:hypothetical protein
LTIQEQNKAVVKRYWDGKFITERGILISKLLITIILVAFSTLPSDRSFAQICTCGSPCYVLLTNESLSHPENIDACLTIEVGPNVIVWGSAEITLNAGKRIVMNGDVIVDNGAIISLNIDPSLLPCSNQPIGCGVNISAVLGATECKSGPLGESHFAELFTHVGQIGDQLLIEADWSFDGYLLLEDPDGLLVAENDNHTSSSNSRIEHHASKNGTYKVWATSYLPNVSGPFELSLTCSTPSGPDLIPDVSDLSETDPLPMEPITMETWLWNVGDSAANSTTLHYHLSSDPVISPSDVEIGSDGASGLASGAYEIHSFNFSSPGTSGTYWLGVCADAVPSEAITSNNCSGGRVIRVTNPPDCTVNQLVCGGEVFGALNSADCMDGPRGYGYFAEVFQIVLESGQATQLTASWSDVDGYLYLVNPAGSVVAQNDDFMTNAQSRIEYLATMSGIYSIWLTTYARDTEGEFGLVATCGETQAPDLHVGTVLIDVADVQTNETVDLTVTVRNDGNATAGVTTLKWMLSTDELISPLDSVIGTVAFDELAAGGSRVVEDTVEAPSTPGHYWIGACVDPVAGEALTNNNCSQ